MVFIAFRKRLYQSWYLFLDDLAVATGRPPCLAPGPSGAADVVELCRESSAGEVATVCRSRRSGKGACHSPIAHWGRVWVARAAAGRALFRPVSRMFSAASPHMNPAVRSRLKTAQGAPRQSLCPSDCPRGRSAAGSGACGGAGQRKRHARHACWERWAHLCARSNCCLKNCLGSASRACCVGWLHSRGRSKCCLKFWRKKGVLRTRSRVGKGQDGQRSRASGKISSGERAARVPAARALIQPAGRTSLISGLHAAFDLWREDSLPVSSVLPSRIATSPARFAVPQGSVEGRAE